MAQTQPPANPAPAAAAPVTPEEKNLTTLRSLAELLKPANEELERLRKELSTATTEESKKDLNARIEAQKNSISELRQSFSEIAAGVDDSAYQSQAEKELTLQQQFSELLDPVLRELQNATAKPREMESLRGELEKMKTRKAVANEALARIDALAKDVKDKHIKAELENTRKMWTSRLASATSDINVLEIQIDERMRKDPSLWGTISGMFMRFWKSRGLNLLFALGVFIAVLVITRKIWVTIRKYSPFRRNHNDALLVRVADLVAMAAGVLLAIFSALLVLYIKGDWLLLTLAAILLIGIVWASKAALPPYIDQIKIMLNLGPIREGERIIHNGLPWRVDRLNVYCEFSNPELTGGYLRLPVRGLKDLCSRPMDPKEPWFPCRIDEWVRLDDGCSGKVIQQTPEQVVILKLGSSLKTYETSTFLSKNPENLSRGFRILRTFGIDYDHQKIATQEAPQILQRALQEAMIVEVERENLRSVKVEFANAAANSLDFTILADFNGEVASRFGALERLIQRVCVDVCNEQGWEIPFTQVMVHTKGESGKAPVEV